MLADTHCHLDFSQFAPDRDEVIQRAQDSGVEFIVNIGSSLSASKRAVELAQANDFIFASVGVHPHYALEVTPADAEEIGRLAQKEKVVAIGEIGLDYYNFKMPQESISQELKIRQQRVLCKFLELAKKTALPIIIHCRQAHQEILGLIQDCLPIPIHGVVHCFSEDKKFLDECLKLGLFVSFTANITYKKSERLRELVAETPLERMLLETDAPYLPPQCFRGKRNEPAYVKFLAQEIARIKKIDFEKVASLTTQNARSLFKIKEK